MPVRRRAGLPVLLFFLVSCLGDESAGPRPIPSALEIAAGGVQTGVVAQPLDSALTVRVLDQHGAAMAGVLVQFTAPASAGTLSPGASTTGPDGTASSTWTLPTGVGSYSAYARLAEGDSVAFRAIAAAGDPAAMVVVSGDSQSTLARSRLPVDVVVRVDDQYGNPVPGRYVQFAPLPGEGSVQFANVVTLSGGLATTRWSLGDSAGPMRLVARVDTTVAETLFATARFITPPSMDFAMGPEHGCAIGAGGGLKCWGANRSGEVSPSLSPEYSPVDAATGLTAKAVSAGYAVTCAIASDDLTRCWGHDPYTGSSAPSGSTPSLVDGNHAFVAISSGTFHTCGLEADGAAWCWGLNGNGELGSGAASLIEQVPVRVNTSTPFAAITGGTGFTCALTRYGEAYCWGLSGTGQLGEGPGSDRYLPTAVPTSLRFESIEAGSEHVCGIAVGGAGYCWGSNASGKLGGGPNPTQSAIVAVAGGLSFSAIAAGGEHSCGLATDGMLYCWGGNWHGAVGGGAADYNFSPVAVAAVPMRTTVLGDWTSCARAQVGSIYCWGDNRLGQAGLGPTAFRTTPVVVQGGGRFVSLTTGSGQTCAQDAQGATFCWGGNTSGEGGRPDPFGATSPVPTLVGHTLLQVEAGYLHSCGVVEGLGGACWGHGRYLGIASAAGFIPTPSPLKGGETWRAVVTSEEESCGLQADSTATCWGWDSSPVATPGSTRFTTLAAGGSMMCGLSAPDSVLPGSGYAYCWTVPGQTPSLVNNVAGLQSLTVGQGSACGLLADGTAMCWTAGMVAAPVSTALKFIALDKGDNHTCGIATDGTAHCWGYNWYGALGDGTTSGSETTTPSPVQTSARFVAISAGQFHTCGITTVGDTLCWGLNFDGQLGNGESAAIPTPRLVF